MRLLVKGAFKMGKRYCLWCGQELQYYYYFCSSDCQTLYRINKELEEIAQQLQKEPETHPLCLECEYDCKIITNYPEGKITCRKYPSGIDFKMGV